MTDVPADGKWPRLLSLSVHELRTPISVVAGYLRMVLKDPTGTLDDRYRRMLEEGEKSCGRLAAIVAEMSELSALEAGTAAFKRAPVDIRAILAEAISALPAVPDRTVEVQLATDAGRAVVEGDAPRLKAAFAAILHGLRREVVATDRLMVHERTGVYKDKPASWISVADADHIDALIDEPHPSLTTFDEWRGGCGLSLAVARRIIDGHAGGIWSLADGPKTAAIVALPLS
jgi:two-component system, OmpR family, sensor histidine kinase VicK